MQKIFECAWFAPVWDTPGGGLRRGWSRIPSVLRRQAAPRLLGEFTLQMRNTRKRARFLQL
jgi:hypothetical protein